MDSNIGGILPELRQADMQYKCSLCEDSGFVVRDIEGRKLARPCECLVREQTVARYERLMGLSSCTHLRHMTFESYEPQNAVQHRSLEALKSAHRSYYISGPIGTGKTHLLVASAQRAMSLDIPSLVISVPKMLDEMRRHGREGSLWDEELARNIPYLALDDLGKERATDWTTERLWILIDERYIRHRNNVAHTSITSNLCLSDLGKLIEPSIADRIRGMCMEVIVPGSSYRKNTGGQR